MDDIARMRLVDSHAHLQSDAFANDADEVLDAARAAGVERVLVPAWDLDSSRDGLAFARRHGLPAAVGLHPHVAGQADAATWAALCALATQPEVVALGETGLDYDRAFSPRADQLANLRRHIELSLELARPLILHCRSKPGERDAQDDLIRELREAGVGEPAWQARFAGRPPGVLHSFSGPVDYAEAALGMGLAIAFGGLVFRAGEEASADVARLVPRIASSSRLTPPTSSLAASVAAATSPATWPSPRAGCSSCVVTSPDAFGTALVAAFDRFVGADPT